MKPNVIIDASKLPVESVKKMVDAYFDYKKTVAVEKTKRIQIESQKEIILKCLDAYSNEIRESSKEQHIKHVTAIEFLGQILIQNAKDLDPEVVINLSQKIVDIVKTDDVSNRIKSMSLNLNEKLNQSLLDKDVIDI
jgi:hypothetical protein